MRVRGGESVGGSVVEPIAGLVLVFGVAIPLMVYYRRMRKRQAADAEYGGAGG